MKSIFGIPAITLMLAFTAFAMAVQMQPQLKSQAVCNMESAVITAGGLNGSFTAVRHNCLNTY